ncbi:TonB-dependent receptor plug domain-containing protein [Sphingomonas faeni]|uniref:TonB-dependent receptor plug domain-containing protein n=1 Tax=Sphingomonas faeni TaxID=185950 RepID=UPI0027D8556D|nr:TonB-dependent receptor [Sphingomonas faeni]
MTGTNIRGGDPSLVVKTLRRKDVERAGLGTVADAISARVVNFGGSGNPVAALTGSDGAGVNYSMTSSANLHGLGAGATLTLFDGRRVAGSGARGDLTDLSAIPSLAVDRVEILTDGASAIYGSDAIGGVVNILLRHRRKGLEVRTRIGSGRDGRRNGLLSSSAGIAWSTGSLFAAYDFEHRDGLSAADRSYTSTGDLSPFGGSDHRSFISSPGTILAFDPATSAYIPAFAIPALAAGRQPTPAEIRPGMNLSNVFAGVDLSPRFDRHAGYVRLNQDVGSAVDLFAETRYSRRTFRYGGPAAQAVFVVPAANPYFVSLGGQTSSVLAYSFIGDLGPSRAQGLVSAVAITGGATWRAGGDWTVEGYGTHSLERSAESLSNQLNVNALNEALGAVPDDPSTVFAASRDGFFNPYGSGGANSAVVLDFAGSGYSHARRRSSVDEAVVKGEGPLLGLPAVEARLAVGLSYRRENLRSVGKTFTSGAVPTKVPPLEGARGIGAVFGELKVPVIGPSNATAGMQALGLTLALRHESYADFGRTTNPKIGVSWLTAEGVRLRASWSTSFRAPALAQTREPRRVAPTVLRDIGGGPAAVLTIAGGNPELDAERAATSSAGFSLEPAGMRGLTFSAGVFSTSFRKRIAQPALLDLSRTLADPRLAAFVQRITPATDPVDLAKVGALLAEPGASPEFYPASGYVAIIDTRFANTSSLKVSGVDAELGLMRRLGESRLGVNLSATWLFRYSERLTPQSRPVDRLNTLGYPADLRLRGTADVTRGSLSVFVAGNFVGGYKDDASTPNRRIAAFMTADLNVGYVPGAGPLKGCQFSVGVENVFDADPPFVDRANGLGFDAANASPFGRIIAVEMKRSW